MTDFPERYFLYQGRSMWPVFQDGDLLEIEAVPPRALQAGDCVIFRNEDGQRIVHRLILHQGQLRSRGDAFAEIDSRGFAPDRLLGKVTRRYRLGRSSTVDGGWRGRVAASIYHWVGRLDPERKGRGGRLARSIRSLAAPLLTPLWHRGQTRALRLPGQPRVVVWGLCGIDLARRAEPEEEWQVVWPWSLVIERPAVRVAGKR